MKNKNKNSEKYPYPGMRITTTNGQEIKLLEILSGIISCYPSISIELYIKRVISLDIYDMLSNKSKINRIAGQLPIGVEGGDPSYNSSKGYAPWDMRCEVCYWRYPTPQPHGQ